MRSFKKREPQMPPPPKICIESSASLWIVARELAWAFLDSFVFYAILILSACHFSYTAGECKFLRLQGVWSSGDSEPCPQPVLGGAPDSSHLRLPPQGLPSFPHHLQCGWLHQWLLHTNTRDALGVSAATFSITTFRPVHTSLHQAQKM